jgi:hypothetical protein
LRELFFLDEFCGDIGNLSQLRQLQGDTLHGQIDVSRLLQ